MASIEELIMMMALGDAQKKAISDSDPYAGGSQIADQIGAAVAQSGPQYSTRDKIIYGALSGLVGGGFDSLSEDYTNRAQDAYLKSMTGELTERPRVLSPALFRSAQEQRDLFKLKTIATAAETEREFQKQKRLEEMKAGVATGADYNKEVNKKKVFDLYAGGGEPVPAAAAVLPGIDADGDGAIDEVVAPVETSPVVTTTTRRYHPDDPRFKLQQETNKEADAARSEISKYPSVAAFNASSTGLKKIEALADIDSKTSDIPFVYGFIQAQDGTAVKEGEIAMVQGASPLLQRYKAILEGELNGKSMLTPTLKRQMIGELRIQQKALFEQAKLDSQRRVTTALSRGVTDEGSVWPFDPKQQIDTTSPLSDAARAAQILLERGIDISNIPDKAPGVTRGW